MNLQIYSSWFHVETDFVGKLGTPLDPHPPYNSRQPIARGHCMGCWALYRILGRYYP